MEQLLPWLNLLLVPLLGAVLSTQRRLTKVETILELVIDGKLKNRS